MLETFTVDTFRAHVGSDFEIAAVEGDGVTVQLVVASEMSERTGASGNGARAPFSLLFHGPAEAFLPQGTYLIRHEAIGEFPLFIVPLGPEHDRMRYEVIFT